MAARPMFGIWSRTTAGGVARRRGARRGSMRRRGDVRQAESLEPRTMLAGDLVNNVPGQQTAYVDTYQFGNNFISRPLAFTAVQGNGISVTHPTIGPNPIRVSLSVDAGTLTLVHPNPNGGITFRTGDGYQDSTMVFEGTLANVNEALSWVGYTPPVTEIFQFNPNAGGNGHWYQLVQKSANWDEARADAVARGGYLATTTSAVEDAFVRSLLYDPSVSYWLGGYQDTSSTSYKEPEGGWRWVTGESWAYTKWNAGEPNNGLGGPVENYLQGNVSGTGNWNDGVKTTALPYVIEYDKDPRQPRKPSATFTITTNVERFAGSVQSDTDTVTILLEPLPGFAPPPSYTTNPARLDDGFGTNGLLVVQPGPGVDYVTDMRVLADGRIVVVGAINGAVGAMRFNSDMSPDTTFGSSGDGGIRIDLGALGPGGTPDPVEMDIDQSGRIIILTSKKIVRLTAEGRRDPTFGTDGIADLAIERFSYSVGTSICTTPEGTYLVSVFAGGTDGRFHEYDENGTFLKLVRDWSNDDYSGVESAVVVRDDGAVLVIGPSKHWYGTQQSEKVHLLGVTYRPSNTTFVHDRNFSTALAGAVTIRSSLLLPDGKVLLVGSGSSDFFICRVLGDGRLDTTFGTNGETRVNILNNNDDGWRAALTADGKIVVTGVGYNGVDNDICVIRMSYDGVLDPTFGLDGKVSVNKVGDGRGHAVAVLPDGKILVAGRQGDDFAFVRLLGNGPDPDGPQDIVLSPASVPETAAVGDVVGSLAAQDRTPGDTITYALVPGAGGEDNGRFLLSDGQLLVNSPLDFETKSRFSVRVRATDQGGLSYEKAIAIDVTDVNETPAAPALSATRIPEGVPLGTAVGTLTAPDPDLGDAVTFSLVAGSGSIDNTAFVIVGNTLRTAVVFDADIKDAYAIRIRATDRAGAWAESTFTITITNVNEPPQSLDLSETLVPETASTIGILTTTDPDAGSTFTYRLASGPGDVDNAWFTIVSDELRPASTLDFETKTSYRVRVRSTDEGGLFIEKAFTITVTDVAPEPPKAIALSAATVAENGPPDTVVGTFTSTDDDPDDTFTYSLVDGTGDGDNSSFVIAGSELRTTASFDRETKSALSVRVRSTDAVGLSAERVFQITVTNVNETPTGLALSNASILEGNLPGAVVGTFSTADPDVGDRFTYALVSGEGADDNSLFSIVGNSLRASASLDADLRSAYSIRVRTTDAGGLWFERTFTITPVQKNESPTDIALAPTSIPENRPAGTAVGTLSTTDPDVGDTFTYVLVAGVGSGDNAWFTIVGDELRTRAPFDFEKRTSYSVRIRSADRGGLFREKVFGITVTNVNEGPTGIALSAATIAENQEPGGTVGTLSTTDPDAGGSFTYSLVDGAGATDNASFTIVGSELRTAASFDHEAKKSLSVRVRSMDGGGLFTEKAFTIAVTNVNEAPAGVLLSATAMPENRVPGTLVGTLSASDVDAGDTFTYALVGGEGSDDNASFRIFGNRLRNGVMFDYETKNTYSIRVRVTDAGGLSAEQMFSVNVTDGNDAPVGLMLSETAVDENSPPGTTVGTFGATDGDGDGITYALVGGTGSADNASFTVVGNALRTAVPLDFETKPIYFVRARATDPAGAFTEQTFAIEVRNVNEAPAGITLSGMSVVENQEPGTVVGTFSSTDPDVGDTFAYTLVSGAGDADNGSFAIVGNTLRTATPLDFETKAARTVRVRATDAGGLWMERAFTITVTNVNEAPTGLALSGATVAENLGPTAIGTLSAADPDAGDSVAFTLVNGEGAADNAAFAIVGNQLRSRGPFDFETKSGYSVRVRATDRRGLATERAFAILVTDVAEAVLTAPTIASVVAGRASVAVAWRAPSSSGGSAIRDYLVQYSSDGGATWTLFNDRVSTATTASVTGLTNGTSYVFRVAAVNGNGAGPYSDPSVAVTPDIRPNAPTSLVANVVNGEVRLGWGAPLSNGGSAVRDYLIQYSTNNGLSWTTFDDGVSTSTSAAVGGLAGGRRYTFRVAAVNGGGVGAFASRTVLLP